MKEEEKFGQDLVPICFLDYKRNNVGIPGKSSNKILAYNNNTLYLITKRSDYSLYGYDGFVKLTKFNLIFSSKDDGISWTENSLPDQTQISEFQSIYFSVDTFVTFWKTSSTATPIQISYSNDLSSWRTNATTETNSSKASFFDKDNIWIYTSSKIYKFGLTTGNMNLLYTSPLAEQTAGENILDIKFVTAQIGYSISKSYLKKTTDGGSTWTIVYTINNDSITDFFVLNSSSVWLRSSFPKLYYSNDGGNNFTANSLGENLKSGKMIFTSSSNGMISNNNMLYTTSDSGANWKLVSFTSTTSVSDILFATANTGYLSNQKQIFKTTDFGNTWSKQTDSADSFNYELMNPLMTSANILLIACLQVAKYSGHPPDK